MSAGMRPRTTALRKMRTAPKPTPNIAKRLLLLAVLAIAVVISGSAVAAFAFVSGVKAHLSAGEFLSSENSVILASNHKVLFQSINAKTGSRVLKPLELNPKNPKVCPQGRETRSKKFFYTFDSYRVQYLTCNGWGIPAKLANATIATEDPTFYSNPGFDPLSIARAALQDLTSGQIQSGASTLAQQIVKLFVLRNSAPTFARKAKEIVVAYQLTQRFPKKFILYLYLNGVYYGAFANGVQAASETYFHRDVSRLKLWQAAMIAGLPQSPTFYNPLNASSISASGQYPAWYIRMQEVLNFLQQRGYISQRREKLAAKEAAHYRFHASTSDVKDADFVTFVEDQLQSMTNPESGAKTFDPYLTRHLGHRDLNSGLKIITTLHPRLQAVAQSDVDTQVGTLKNEDLNVTDGALVSINVRPGCYGCIMAMVGNGGNDPQHIDINMANSPRQPGSSFKVFNYVSAFEKGLSPASKVLDGPVEIPEGTDPETYYSPLDYSQTWTGVVTVRYALGNSLNVPAVRTEVWNGPNTIARTAFKFGITDFYKDNPGCCAGEWATTLGGLQGGVRLIQETQAYGAFATGGVRVPAISFTKIIDRATGRVLWQRSKDTWLKKQAKRVAPAADVYMISSILSDNITRAPEFGDPGYDPLDLDIYNAAAKTGTTNTFKDNWTVGYTPQVVTGVWVGNANNSPMATGVNGITGAAPIWHTFMLQAFPILHLQNLPFNPPAGMATTATCTNQPYWGEPAEGSYEIYDDDPSYPGGYAPTFVAGAPTYCQVPAVIGLDTATPYEVVTPTPVPVVPQTSPSLPTLQG